MATHPGITVNPTTQQVTEVDLYAVPDGLEFVLDLGAPLAGGSYKLRALSGGYVEILSAPGRGAAKPSGPPMHIMGVQGLDDYESRYAIPTADRGKIRAGSRFVWQARSDQPMLSLALVKAITVVKVARHPDRPSAKAKKVTTTA